MHLAKRRTKERPGGDACRKFLPPPTYAYPTRNSNPARPSVHAYTRPSVRRVGAARPSAGEIRFNDLIRPRANENWLQARRLLRVGCCKIRILPAAAVFSVGGLISLLSVRYARLGGPICKTYVHANKIPCGSFVIARTCTGQTLPSFR